MSPDTTLCTCIDEERVCVKRGKLITVMILTSIFMTSSTGGPLQALIFMFHETQVHCTVSQVGMRLTEPPEKSWQQKIIRVFHFSIKKVFFDCSVV